MARKAAVRLPGKGNSNSHGARPVHLIITRIKWIRTSGSSIKNSLSLHLVAFSDEVWVGEPLAVQRDRVHLPWKLGELSERDTKDP